MLSLLDLTFGVIKLFIRNSSVFSFHRKLHMKKNVLGAIIVEPFGVIIVEPFGVSSLWNLLGCHYCGTFLNCFWCHHCRTFWCHHCGTFLNCCLVPSLWYLLQLFDVIIIILFLDFLLHYFVAISI